MNRSERLAHAWQEEYGKLRSLEFFRRLEDGSFTKEHYIAFLAESYHNVTHNTKKMALFQAHIRTDRAALESRFLKHAATEIGHDAMALDDLRKLGADAEAVRNRRPLPSTEALTGFIVFQIQHRNPYAYLGYLYHLEALPTTIGEAGMKTLHKAGIPVEAMSFLQEHSEADVVHMKWNREYLDGFLEKEEDYQAALYGLRGSCHLHGAMLQASMDSVR